MTGGSRFTADNIAGEYTPPGGDLFQGFEGTTYEGWTATGDAFGDGPARGNVPPQGGVGGFLGNGLANSFHGEDRGTGTLTSPAFTVTKPYLNFLVGGGNHPYPGTETNKPVAVNLVVGGAVVRTKTGKDGETLNCTNWNVADLKGWPGSTSSTRTPAAGGTSTPISSRSPTRPRYLGVSASTSPCCWARTLATCR